MRIEKYQKSLENEWNSFVDESKNGTFLFRREYMEYHADRFSDASILIYENDKLIALLPANRENEVIYSHQGLTYGGLILSYKITTTQVLSLFSDLFDYFRSQGVIRWVYKCIPHIYHRFPAEEDLYALFRFNAKLIARNISTLIPVEGRLRFSELRRRGVKKALKRGLVVSESQDYALFWKVLTENLQTRYSKTPVHSLQEISYLHSMFPQRIRLFVSSYFGNVMSGCVVYEMDHIAHIQYISASSEGKDCGALDFLFDHLIQEIFKDKIVDFGQSTEEMGYYLNEGLIFQKEGFGGRGIVYDTYELNI